MRNPISKLTKLMMLSALVCFVPVVGGCSPVRAHSAALATAPFPQYRTFSFGTDEASPAGFKSTPRTAVVEQKMLPLITTVLQEKGYVPAEAGKKGDVVVAVASGSRKGITHPRQSSRAAADGMDDDEEDDFVEGAIVIDMFDGLNDGQVWHGASRAEINPDKIDDELLARSVRSVLAPFPIHAGAAPQAAK